MKRSNIEQQYEQLQELKEMERLLLNQKDKSESKQWMKVVTPHSEYNFLNSDLGRKNFMTYLQNQIATINIMLNLESED